jgi:AcrR family transcriptional regulator
MNVMNPPTANARDRLIGTAIDLFNRHGFHATGVDRIVAAAKVAKKTLYAHFPSKEDLILAALSRQRAALADRFLAAAVAASDQPRARLLTLFELANTWFSDPEFFGCMFVSAAAEYSDPGHPINACAREFKTLLHGFARDQAAAGGAADPETLADQIALLFEGAIAVAHVSAQPDAAITAKGVAARLIDHAFQQ